jgi:hypothetical protein
MLNYMILSRFRVVACVTYRRVLEWVIGFIDTLFTQLGTTCNYSAIADLHTLQFTTAHTLGFSVFTSRILATDAQSNSFLDISSQSPSTADSLSSIPLLPSSYPGRLASRNTAQFLSTELFFITTLHRLRRKHSLSIVGKACLQHRCIATEVTRLLLAFSLLRECVYSVVA